VERRTRVVRPDVRQRRVGDVRDERQCRLVEARERQTEGAADAVHEHRAPALFEQHRRAEEAVPVRIAGERHAVDPTVEGALEPREVDTAAVHRDVELAVRPSERRPCGDGVVGGVPPLPTRVAERAADAFPLDRRRTPRIEEVATEHRLLAERAPPAHFDRREHQPRPDDEALLVRARARCRRRIGRERSARRRCAGRRPSPHRRVGRVRGREPHPGDERPPPSEAHHALAEPSTVARGAPSPRSSGPECAASPARPVTRRGRRRLLPSTLHGLP
jgi:hypothetical protein